MSVFIVLEGIDGCGKSSVCQWLVKKYKEAGHKVWHTQEPWQESPSGLRLRNYLQKTTLPNDEEDEQNVDEENVDEKNVFAQKIERGDFIRRLFVENRLEHSAVIKEKLANGVSVFCERYDVSTYAYQTLQMGALQQTKAFKEMLAMHRYGEEDGALVPDVTFFCSVPAEIAMQRIETRLKEGGSKERFEKLGTLQKVAANYQQSIEFLNTQFLNTEVNLNAEVNAQENWHKNLPAKRMFATLNSSRPFSHVCQQAQDVLNKLQNNLQNFTGKKNVCHFKQ